MTREQALTKAELNSHKGGDLLIMHTTTAYTLIHQIYDDFEEELKKAYIEGSDDAWKARNESIEKAIASVEDSYGWMTYEDKQNCIEILYELRGK